MGVPTATTSGAEPSAVELRRWRRRLSERLEVVRDLPWRDTRDPWAILVAELMLQQTQVARVIPSWERFISAMPDPATCAAAGRAEVLRAWEGLGYHRRAVALHAAASAITEEHGGQVPGELGTLLALPGIGPYTARAVLAFAFEQDVAVVDTNVARVLSRAVAGRPLRAKQVQELADSLVPPGGGWRHNQALLDLGALHCRARARCSGCTLRRSCAWTRAGQPEPDPALTTAGTSRAQSRFEGSDRQLRGRVLAALRPAQPPEAWLDELRVSFGSDRVQAAIAALLAEGLIERDGSELVLAGS